MVLREHDINIKAIINENQGISDEQVMEWAISEDRTILTHDSDYDELIFKFGFKPEAGVIYFRMYDFEPMDPAKVLLDLLSREITFKKRLTVINENSIRQRSF